MVDRWVERRREIADLYRAGLADTVVSLPFEQPYGRHCYYLYVVEHDDRDSMIARLGERQVMCNISYPWPIHIMRGYAYLGYKEGDFPIAENKAKRIFSLPMYPYLTNDQVARVIDAVRAVQ